MTRVCGTTACTAQVRQGPPVDGEPGCFAVAYNRTTFSTRVPRVMPRKSTTSRARVRTCVVVDAGVGGDDQRKVGVL